MIVSSVWENTTGLQPISKPCTCNMHLSVVGITVLATLVIVAGKRMAAEYEAEITKADGRIANGVNALPGQFPWAVSIQRKDKGKMKHICMGALIGRRHILTSARFGDAIVEDPMRLKMHSAVLGAHDIYDVNETSRAIHKLCRYHQHPKRNPNGGVEYDVGVITLTHPVTYTERIKPIRLIPREIDPAMVCSLAGWGMHTVSNPYSKEKDGVLKTLNVTGVSADQCAYPMETVVCALNPERQEPSTGDVGTPLVCYDEKGPYAAAVYLEVGEVGWSIRSSNFIKVSDVLDFILCSKARRG